ncbi:MAG: hypothetical protein C4293_12530 [Nitrospiraceae bacterium]
MCLRVTDQEKDSKIDEARADLGGSGGIGSRRKPVTVQQLLGRWAWKPIRNCPGRFVLMTDQKQISLETLLGGHCRAQTFASDAAKDTVIVVPLEDGGLISYAHRDGKYVHTLNTAEGFARKLSQLGIRLAGPEL